MRNFKWMSTFLALLVVFGFLPGVSSGFEKSNVISPNVFVPVDEFPGSIYAGPVYHNYTQNFEREVADAITAYAASKIPVKFTQNPLFNWLFNKLTGWAKDLFHPTYVGTWITRVTDPYDSNLYDYYVTVVYYEDSSHDTPLDVQYYLTAQERKR